MKTNLCKYHLLLSASKINGNKTISSSKNVLGIKIDNNLNFKEHIESSSKSKN